MVKVRNNPSPALNRATPGKRERALQHNSSAGPSKRPLDVGIYADEVFSREGSPGKSVHFKRGLIQGPTVIDPRRRSESPTRSALHKRDSLGDGPSAQLQTEMTDARPSSKKRKKDMRAKIEAVLDGTGTPLLEDDSRGRAGEGQNSHGWQRRPILSERPVHKKARGDPKTAKQKGPRTVQPVEKGIFEEKLQLLTEAEMLHESSAAAANEATKLDEEICSRLNDVLSAALNFAKSLPPVLISRRSEVLSSLLKPENAQLVRYIGCLVLGGKDFTESWRAILADTTCRSALVFGIIGRSLKEYVFSELYFGACEDLVEELSKMEREQAHLDGFYRTRQRADTILIHRAKHTDTASLSKDIAKLTLQLERMLLPLWSQATNGNLSTWHTSNKRRELAHIITLAAHLSRRMRTERDIVYYWPPTFKDEEFEPGRMECLNLRSMITESPYDKKEIGGMDRAVLREGHENQSQAIVRVVCWPGLVAYRQHGGELAQQELAAEETTRLEREGSVRIPADVQTHRKRLSIDPKTNTLTGNEGFRTRVLSKSVVLLQWGKQRLLTKEAGTSVHIDAMKDPSGKGMKKYENDRVGCVELGDIYREVLKGKTVEQVQREVEIKEVVRTSSWGEGWSVLWSSSMSREPEATPSNAAVVKGDGAGSKARSVSKGKR